MSSSVRRSFGRDQGVEVVLSIGGGSAPALVTAATCIDSRGHAIEAYTSKIKIKKNPMSDQLARHVLSLLAANIKSACRVGSDLEALWSILAGLAFANAPVAAVHVLAYPIGAMFHVPRGLSNALVLKHVLEFNRAAAEPLYAQLLEGADRTQR